MFRFKINNINNRTFDNQNPQGNLSVCCSALLSPSYRAKHIRGHKQTALARTIQSNIHDDIQFGVFAFLQAYFINIRGS